MPGQPRTALNFEEAFFYIKRYEGSDTPRLKLRFKLANSTDYWKLRRHLYSIGTPTDNSLDWNEVALDIAGSSYVLQSSKEDHRLTLSPSYASDIVNLNLVKPQNLSELFILMGRDFNFSVEQVGNSLKDSLPLVAGYVDDVKSRFTLTPPPRLVLPILFVAAFLCLFVVSALLGFGPTSYVMSKLLYPFVETILGNLILIAASVAVTALTMVLLGFLAMLDMGAAIFGAEENYLDLLPITIIGGVSLITGVLGLGSLIGFAQATQYLQPSLLLTIGSFLATASYFSWDHYREGCSRYLKEINQLEMLNEFDNTENNWVRDWQQYVAEPINNPVAVAGAGQGHEFNPPADGFGVGAGGTAGPRVPLVDNANRAQR